MANRWKGNFVIATEATSSGTDYTGKANGSWSLNNQIQQKQANLWAKGVVAPSAPTIGTAAAAAGNANASVAFTASSDAGAPGSLTYTATSTPGSLTNTGSSSPIVVSGLTNGTPYTFKVKATNSAGLISSESAASNSITPTASVDWMSLSSITGGNVFGYGVSVDSSNNAYIAGAITESGNQDGLVVKINTSTGTLEWQKKLSGETTDILYSSVVDSSSNVYVAGYTNTARDTLLAKYDSAGNLLWQRKLDQSSANDTIFGVTLDSSGNPYVLGYTTNSTPLQNILLAKYNSSGTIQWARTFSTGSVGSTAYWISIDSSDNVYFGGYIGANISGVIIKYNPSTGIAWQRYLTPPGSGAILGRGNAADSSGNVYFALTYSSPVIGTTAVIVKYNSSGALQWQRSIQAGASPYNYTCAQNALIVGSDGYIYGLIVATSPDATDSDIVIYKYSSAGVIQWMRKLTASGVIKESDNTLVMDTNNNLTVVGSLNNGTNTSLLLARVPTDGSKTGSYVLGSYTMNYSVALLGEVAGTLVDSAGALTVSTITATDSAGSLTDSTTSLTTSTVIL